MSTVSTTRRTVSINNVVATVLTSPDSRKKHLCSAFLHALDDLKDSTTVAAADAARKRVWAWKNGIEKNYPVRIDLRVQSVFFMVRKGIEGRAALEAAIERDAVFGTTPAELPEQAAIDSMPERIDITNLDPQRVINRMKGVDDQPVGKADVQLRLFGGTSHDGTQRHPAEVAAYFTSLAIDPESGESTKKRQYRLRGAQKAIDIAVMCGIPAEQVIEYGEELALARANGQHVVIGERTVGILTAIAKGELQIANL